MHRAVVTVSVTVAGVCLMLALKAHQATGSAGCPAGQGPTAGPTPVTTALPAGR